MPSHCQLCKKLPLRAQGLHEALFGWRLEESRWSGRLYELVQADALVVGDFLPANVLLRRVAGVDKVQLWPLEQAEECSTAMARPSRSFGQALCSTAGMLIDLAKEEDKDSADDSDVVVCQDAEEVGQEGSEEEEEEGVSELILDSLRDLTVLETWSVSDDDGVPLPGAFSLSCLGFVIHGRLLVTVLQRLNCAKHLKESKSQRPITPILPKPFALLSVFNVLPLDQLQKPALQQRRRS